jgi:hypothetical protein
MKKREERKKRIDLNPFYPRRSIYLSIHLSYPHVHIKMPWKMFSPPTFIVSLSLLLHFSLSQLMSLCLFINNFLSVVFLKKKIQISIDRYFKNALHSLLRTTP